MAGEKEPRKRTAFGPHYCPEELLSEVNSIPEIASGITGTDKVAAIKRSFDFYHEWKDKVDNLGEAASDEQLAAKDARIAELEGQLSQKETELEEIRSAANDSDEKDARIAELEEQVSRMEADLSEAQQATNEEKDARIAELESRIETLKAEVSQEYKPTWEAIRQTLDPVYADMMEEMSRALGVDDPLMTAVDIFAKYHIKRLTELPFQPFIPEKLLDQIILSHYPDSGGLRELQKKLK